MSMSIQDFLYFRKLKRSNLTIRKGHSLCAFCQRIILLEKNYLMATDFEPELQLTVKALISLSTIFIVIVATFVIIGLNGRGFAPRMSRRLLRLVGFEPLCRLLPSVFNYSAFQTFPRVYLFHHRS